MKQIRNGKLENSRILARFWPDFGSILAGFWLDLVGFS